MQPPSINNGTESIGYDLSPAPDAHAQRVIAALALLQGEKEDPASLELLFAEFEHIKMVLQRKFPRASPELVDEAVAQALSETWRKLKASALPSLKNPAGYFWKLALWRFQTAFERQQRSQCWEESTLPAPSEEPVHVDPIEILAQVYARCKKRHRNQRTLEEAWGLLQQLHRGISMKTLLENDGFSLGTSKMRVERDRRYQIIHRLRRALQKTAHSMWKDHELVVINKAIQAAY